MATVELDSKGTRMDLQPAPPHEACYTFRVYRNELRFARDYPDLSAAARKRIADTGGDTSELQFVGATISYATGERFCYLTVERESSDHVVWVKAWRTDAGPATAIVLDKEKFKPVAYW
jgi:hypothetical protein